MKIKIKKNKLLNLWKGLAGIIISVSAFVMPVTVHAEAAVQPASEAVQAKIDTAQKAAEAAQVKSEETQQPAAVSQVKYVMPQEQVYLDPSQVEAAKQQIKADAKYNSNPQNNAVVTVAEKKAVAEEKAAVPQSVLEVNQSDNHSTKQPSGVSQVKYVMPQEQVYLDPSQVEVAKQQKEADAFYNVQPQTKNVEVVTGDRVIADVKVVEQDKKEVVSETEKGTAQQEATKEIKPETPKVAEGKVTQSATKANVNAVENKNENKPATVQQQTVPNKKPFRLNRFGVAREFTTHHATVGEVLQEMKINMEGRTVYPPPETKITDGMVIHVLARKSFLSQEEVEVPYGTQVINDPEMAFGTKKVEKEGVKGKDLVTYENLTRPGHEQKIELDRRRVAEPVNEIVRQGVAQSVLTPEGYVRYKKKIYGEATAYTWGGGATGHTSIGLWPKRGIVAVDPRVIPYYTKLFIPGYGMAIAGDTGGAIVGTRIDLFMDSLHECFQWGRRGVEIYILE